jgi:hypothetical protein
MCILPGTRLKLKYGFFINQSKGSAIAITGRSAHVEVDGFYAYKAQFGCWVKNEASCDTSVNNWILNYISIHDYKMKDIGIEGFYMGSTDPDNWSRPINCNGEQKFYKPTRLGNIKVYNGIIDGTGRPAILLAGAYHGVSEIYNNVITNVGREYNDQQGTGITIGMYTRAYIHHNQIRNTFTWGIASLGGSGMVRIENNRIDSSGYLDGRTSPWAQNIFVDTRKTAPTDSTTFIIRNNTVAHPGRDAAHISIGHSVTSYTRRGNLVCNNGKGARVDVQAGVVWSNCGKVQVASAPLSRRKLLMIGAAAGVLVAGVALVWYLRRNVHISFTRKAPVS